MRVLHGERVSIDTMYAHGGMFRTAGVAQRFLAAALDAPVAVADTASEGGAWGIAVLASYLNAADGLALDAYLAERVFATSRFETVEPDADDLAGYATYLTRYEAGLAIERAAVDAL
jgi:sugar (pentulose or hexulose) kinase